MTYKATLVTPLNGATYVLLAPSEFEPEVTLAHAVLRSPAGPCADGCNTYSPLLFSISIGNNTMLTLCLNCLIEQGSLVATNLVEFA
jgi:hypothetical protein